MGRRRRARSGRRRRRPRLVAYDLNQPAAIALAIELDEEHALPGSEAELAVTHGHGLAGGAEQHRHTVRMPVPDRHVLGTDVLRALVPVVVRVVRLARNESLQQLREVLEKSLLELVDAHAARRVRRVDARDALGDPTLADGLDDLFRDVANGQPARGPQFCLALEDLHGAFPSSLRRATTALFCAFRRPTSRGNRQYPGWLLVVVSPSGFVVVPPPAEPPTLIIPAIPSALWPSTGQYIS